MRLHEDRILFLREFTRELIINSKKDEISISYMRPELEGLQEIFQPTRTDIKILESPIPTQTKPPILTHELGEPQELRRPMSMRQPVFRQLMPLPLNAQSSSTNPPRPMLAHAIDAQSSNAPLTKEKMTIELDETRTITANPRGAAPINFSMNSSPQFSAPRFPNESQILPQPTPLPPGFNLGKLNMFMDDPRITIIECQGPNKLVMARMFGKPTVSRIMLTQEEITIIIESFSKAAKIPIISGLFKAVVGNLIITAVVSDLVGSRFIITKLTPSFAIDQINKGFN